MIAASIHGVAFCWGPMWRPLEGSEGKSAAEIYRERRPLWSRNESWSTVGLLGGTAFSSLKKAVEDDLPSGYLT